MVKIIRFLIVFIALSASVNRGASAALVYTMNMGGTVANGTLDGNSLNGQSFQIEAIFLDQPDQFPEDSVNGLFLSEIAYIEFGNGQAFIFDDGEFAINLQYYDDLNGNPAFAAFAIYDWPSNGNAFLGLADLNVSDAGSKFDGFDPNVLSEFEYSAFDFQLAEGSVTNQLGQTLAISELGPPSTGTYSLVATAVPEPSTFAVLLAMIPTCLIRRARPSSVIARAN